MGSSTRLPRRSAVFASGASGLMMAILVFFIALSFPTPASAAISFCKCMCFTNYTIVPLYRPSNPSKPCLSCTKQFCLDQKLAVCQDAALGEVDPDTGTGLEGDVSTKCFQRDSAKDQTIVIGFILLTAGLLASAFLKERGTVWYDSVLSRFRGGSRQGFRRPGVGGSAGEYAVMPT